MPTQDSKQPGEFQSELWLMRAKELYNLKEQRKNIEALEKQMEIDLRSMQNNEPLEYGGIAYGYHTRPGNIDYESIPELKGVNLDQYRKEQVRVWKLQVKVI